MNIWIYAGDLYCEDCAAIICGNLDQKGLAPDHRDDETTYDSDDFPKGPYPDGGGEADLPQYCGAGPECFSAIKLSDGRKVGAWLKNELTADGVEYVRDAIAAGGEVAEMWNTTMTKE